MSDGWYSREALESFGFLSLGEDVAISTKASIYGAKHMRIGSHVRIDDFCLLVGNITLGDYVHIAAYTGIHASMGSLTVGDFSGISSRTTVYTASDDYSGYAMSNPTVPEKYKLETFSDMVIGRHCLIGTGATLLPHAMLSDGVSVGAMSLVNARLEPWGIYAGIPCRRIKERSKRCLDLAKQLLEEEQR